MALNSTPMGCTLADNKARRDIKRRKLISKFPGRCKGCGKPTNEGEDIYWTKEEGGWHWECWDNRKPGPEAFRLADELGYADHAGLMAGDRPLLLLSRADRDRPATAERRDDTARGLFDSVPRMSEKEKIK